MKANHSQFVVVIPGVSPNGTEWDVWGNTINNKSLHQGRPTSSRVFWVFDGFLPAEAIYPLIRKVGDRRIPSDKTRSFDRHSRSPLSAIIFFGNSTILDLGSTGTPIHAKSESQSNAAMSLSVLLCDPQYQIQRANVTLSDGKLSANVFPTLPLIGNFPETAANALFSQALLETLGPEDQDPGRLVGSISMLLFTGGWNGTGPLHPFPLSVINDNMNRILKSAAKAYLSGYNSSLNSVSTTYALWNQTAAVQYQQLALVTSKSFFIVLLTLSVLTVAVLLALSAVIDIGGMELFNLQTLENVHIGMLHLLST